MTTPLENTNVSLLPQEAISAWSIKMAFIKYNVTQCRRFLFDMLNNLFDFKTVNLCYNMELNFRVIQVLVLLPFLLVDFFFQLWSIDLHFWVQYRGQHGLYFKNCIKTNSCIFFSTAVCARVLYDGKSLAFKDIWTLGFHETLQAQWELPPWRCELGMKCQV